jgi:hypothetical protein
MSERPLRGGPLGRKSQAVTLSEPPGGVNRPPRDTPPSGFGAAGRAGRPDYERRHARAAEAGREPPRPPVFPGHGQSARTGQVGHAGVRAWHT